MKHLFIFSLVVIFGTAFGAADAEAKRTRNKRVVKTQKRQAKRIRHGVKSGELSKAEAKDLRQEQRDINKMRKEARSDGKISKREMKDIRKAQKKASADIYSEKHD